MRLLYARALNDAETAIVIDNGGQLLGGVAIMTEMMQTYTYPNRFHERYRDQMELRFVWVWNQVVSSTEWFERERAWERPPKQISNVKMIEG